MNRWVSKNGRPCEPVYITGEWRMGEGFCLQSSLAAQTALIGCEHRALRPQRHKRELRETFASGRIFCYHGENGGRRAV